MTEQHLDDPQDLKKPIRVLLVDDQALFRAGVRMLIGSQPDMVCVGEAPDGEVACQLVQELSPDIILMDIRMPVMDGIAATQEILSRSETLFPRVIVLTTFDLDESAIRALRVGASGFLLKDSEPEFLLASIRTVFGGSAVIAPSATQELCEHFADQLVDQQKDERKIIPENFNALTARECEIFYAAAKGLSNAEIAQQEYLSEATVKTHISKILTKLALRDRVQMVIYAFEHDLISRAPEQQELLSDH